MKGRKPTSTRLKLLMGNPGKQRLPKGEPQPSSSQPEPPEFLDKYALEEWDRLASGLHSLGLLYDLDRAVFAAYCQSYAQWRAAEELLNDMAGIEAFVSKKASGNEAQNVLINIANKAKSDMVRYGVEFGLTPSARTRLAVDGGRKKGKFDGLLNI